MAEPAPEKQPEQPDAAAATAAADQPKRSSAIMGLLKAIAFVSILVIVEVVAGAMLIPSAKDTEKLAKQYAAASAGHAASGGGEAEGGDKGHDVEAEEFELGNYNITHFNPATNTTLSIDFELFGTVLASDKVEFEKLFEKNKIRAREQVIMTLHAAEAKDLSDAGLGLLKRQILEKTNRALGQPLLKEVLFSKFNFVER